MPDMEGRERGSAEALAQIQEAVLQLKGVYYVRPVADEAGSITELHIVAGASRGAKQVARDVESLLLARFGLRIDRKLLSIAQVEESAEADDALSDTVRAAQTQSPPVVPRLSYEGYTLTVKQGGTQANVILSYQGQLYQGRSFGGPDSIGRSRMMAQATLDAVHHFLGMEPVFSLVEAKEVSVAEGRAALVCLAAHKNYGEELLLGTAFLHHDAPESMVKATLCALNRKLSLLKSE